MTSDARPKLNFAGPLCVIEQSDNLTILEMTPDGLVEMLTTLELSDSLSSNMYALYNILLEIRKSKLQIKY